MLKEKKTTRNDLLAFLIIALIFTSMTVFLYSFENYPLDDDWSYIWAVKHFISTGEMRFTDWTAMSLVSQVWWGGVFSRLLGFSFESVRLSALVISFIGLVFFYLFLRDLGHTSAVSLAVTLLLLLNPFTAPLNFTFFTDIPFLSLLIIASYFFYRGDRKDRDVDLFLGSLFSALALLIRQNGLLIPIAVFLYLLAKEEKKRCLRKGLVAMALPLIAFLVFTYWFNVMHGQTAESLKHANELKDNLLHPQIFLFKLLWRPLIILEFIGFCLLPLSLAYLPAELKRIGKGNYSFLILFALSGIFFFLFFEHLGLFSSIYQWADGFKYAFISEYGIRGAFSILILIYKLIDFASVFSITFLLYLIIKQRGEVKKKLFPPSPFLLILLIGLLQLFFLFVTQKWYSRYFVTVLPFFLILLLEGRRGEKTAHVILLPLLCLYFLFSFVVSQDFMAWNQTRWRAGAELMKEGIPPHKISAGFPWDCWYSYEYSKSHPQAVSTQTGEVPWWIEELTPAVDPLYVISSSPHLISLSSNRNFFQTAQYRVYRSYEYRSLFYLNKKRVYVLKRVEGKAWGPAGQVFLDFVESLPLVEVKPKDRADIMVSQVTLGDITRKALIQPVNTEAVFRIALPRKPCALKMQLGVMADPLVGKGSGTIFKVLIDDSLIDNLEGMVGVVGAEMRNAFLKPRALFAKPRTYLIRYLAPGDQRWEEVTLDLSYFSGRVVDLTLTALPGVPGQKGKGISACWGEPVIVLEKGY